jgi:intraflagellar transport protein 88
MEFGIQLNLGLIYEGLKMFDDAKQMYMEILQKENYYTPGIMFQKVRVNIGNIYYNQGEYRKAITEWQKAVDKISKDNKEMRGMILRNIANAHIKSGNYTDAIDNYNESVKYKEDMKTYMNLLLSNIAFNKIDQTKIAFNRMLESSINIEKEIDATEEKKSTMDALREYLVIRKKENSSIIVNIALVMTHFLEKDPLEAFKYIIEAVKRNNIEDILNEIEMAKAMYFLKKRDVEKTISILKQFENKNKSLISRVANNISFLYFVEGDYQKAESYANIAIENERYNHKALVNMGNIFYIKEDYLKAKEFYLEAIGVQSDCIEAIYNLGMVNIRMDSIYEAIQAFEKLHSVCPNIPEVLYKIAKLYEYTKQYEEAIKYYSLLLMQLPNDPILLSSLGSLYYQINPKDEKTYMHYFEDSYRYFPSNFDNLTVLGFLYFKEEMYEKAIQFFKLASKVNPNAYTAEIHYAKCYYKLGRFPESFKAFKKIHNKYPDNKEALTFLIENARQLNLPYNDYVKELNRIDQEQMTLDGYGQGGYDNMGGYSDDYYGQQPMYNSDYKGERVDFSAYSSKNNTAPKKEINQFMKFNPNQSPDELLP